jgi:hypothetical protein
VDVPDRRWRERRADVRAAALVADVLAGRSVVDEALRTAVDPTPAQLGVKRVEGFRVDRPCLDLPEERADVLLEVLRVHLLRRDPDVQRLEVAVEELVEGGAGTWVPLLVHLVRETTERLLRLGLRARRDDLAEVVPLAGDRVDPGVVHHPQRPTGQRLDAGAGPLAARR